MAVWPIPPRVAAPPTRQANNDPAVVWHCTNPRTRRAPPLVLLQEDHRTQPCWPLLGEDYTCAAAPGKPACWVDAKQAMETCRRDKTCVGVVFPAKLRGDGSLATLKREHDFERARHDHSQTVDDCVQLARRMRCGLARTKNACDWESATKWATLGCSDLNGDGVRRVDESRRACSNMRLTTATRSVPLWNASDPSPPTLLRPPWPLAYHATRLTARWWSRPLLLTISTRVRPRVLSSVDVTSPMW
jgi:hypothetical protein